jgi:hypothetical protein
MQQNLGRGLVKSLLPYSPQPMRRLIHRVLQRLSLAPARPPKLTAPPQRVDSAHRLVSTGDSGSDNHEIAVCAALKQVRGQFLLHRESLDRLAERRSSTVRGFTPSLGHYRKSLVSRRHRIETKYAVRSAHVTLLGCIEEFS